MYRSPLNALGTNLYLVMKFEEVSKEVCRWIKETKGAGPRGCNVEFRVCRVRESEAKNQRHLGWRSKCNRFLYLLRYLTC